MPTKEIKAFSNQSMADPELAEKLKACQKVRELIGLAREHGYAIQEDALYPPNEPEFSEAQLSPKMAKALLRA